MFLAKIGQSEKISTSSHVHIAVHWIRPSFGLFYACWLGAAKIQKVGIRISWVYFNISLCVRSHKKISSLALVFHTSLAPYILRSKMSKIQRKILEVSILPFWAVKPIHKLVDSIGLHSWHLLTPILAYLIMTNVGYHICIIFVKNAKNVIFDVYAIQHMSYLYMTIWESKGV